jgi:hypothetical protein
MPEDRYTPPPGSALCPYCSAVVSCDLSVSDTVVWFSMRLRCSTCRRQWAEDRDGRETYRAWSALMEASTPLAAAARRQPPQRV